MTAPRGGVGAARPPSLLLLLLLLRPGSPGGAGGPRLPPRPRSARCFPGPRRLEEGYVRGAAGGLPPRDLLKQTDCVLKKRKNRKTKPKPFPSSPSSAAVREGRP